MRKRRIGERADKERAGGMEHAGRRGAAMYTRHDTEHHHRAVLLHGVVQLRDTPAKLGDVAADGRACDEQERRCVE